MNFSDERESWEMMMFSFTRWISRFQFVERHPVLEVAVKTVRLLDEQMRQVLSFRRNVEHFSEAGAAGLLGRSLHPRNSLSTVTVAAPWRIHAAN